MAKKKKDKGGEDPADEKIKADNSGEEETKQDAGEGGENDGPESEEKEGASKRSWIKRFRMPGLIAIIILSTLGTLAFLKPDFFSIIKGKRSTSAPIDLTKDNLKEEGLSPFFIPPPADLSRGAIRVDLTVIWDGVAAVRFKTNELRIRSEVYDYLRKAVENTADIESQKPIMEEGMSVIFRKSLGVQDLAVRIKELKSI